MVRPMKTSSWPPSKDTVPMVSLMPYTATIFRAMEVARWMSLLAPVEMSPRHSFSATRPPSRATIRSSM